MNRFINLTILTYAVLIFHTNSTAAVDGTTGTPLGGIGCGAIRYCGSKGCFFAAEYSPCCMGDFKMLKNSGFMLFTNRNNTIKTLSHMKVPVLNDRIEDDAIYPIYNANLMGTNSVSVKLLAFSPVSFDSIVLMCLPYAFFEVTLKNTTGTEVEASCALRIPSGTNSIIKKGKGFQTSSDLIERAVYAFSEGDNITVTVGSDSLFFQFGEFSDTIANDSIIAVAVKVVLGPREEKVLHFVYAWYNRSDPERYYYSNIIKDAGESAEIGLCQFKRLRKNALDLVNGMRSSNFPDWIKDQTLNSLCNLTTNSIYTKDGRHCFTEGMWDVNGTLDQMWHSRQIMVMTIPELVWKELEWWAQTQKIEPKGQIHHDMGNPVSKLWGWEDKQHPEYDYEPNCDNWVDLNCAFIISIYEAFCATGDTTRLKYFWPYIKKTAQRILDQLSQYEDKKYKYTFSGTRNTYDQPGIDADYYNTSLSTVTYKILSIFCDINGDTTLKKTFQNAFENVKTSFKERYLSNNFTPGRFTEALLTGQWIGFFLKLGQFYAQLDIDEALNIMDKYYKPIENGLGFLSGSYEEWAPYLVSHYGGLCLQTGRLAHWKALQYDWYERNYLNRNRVFNQELGIPSKVSSPIYIANDSSIYKQYISVPVLWRNYYTLLGYFRNKFTGELWLEPIILPEMNNAIENGFYLSPEGSGIINVSESVNSQQIIFKPDKPIEVSVLYLRDKASSSDNIKVLINGVEKPVIRKGEGYFRHLQIDYSGIIDSSGININVTWGGNNIRDRSVSSISKPVTTSVFTNVFENFVLPKNCYDKKVLISLYSVKGELIGRKYFEKTKIDLKKYFKISRGLVIIEVKP